MYAIEQNESILIFRVGAILCSVPVRTVDSIVVTPSFHCLPKQAPSVVGVFRYRDSSTVPAVDLHSKFGLSIDPDNPPPRTIVSNGVHGLCGFMVDEVMEITTLDDENWSQPPKFISDNVFDKTLTWREHLVLSTDFDRLRAMKESVPLQAWAAEKNESLLIEAEEGRTEFAADVAMSVIEADHADDAPVIDGPVAEGLAAGTQALDPMEQALDVEPVLEEANAAQAEHLEDLTESPVEEPEVGIESEAILTQAEHDFIDTVLAEETESTESSDSVQVSEPVSTRGGSGFQSTKHERLIQAMGDSLTIEAEEFPVLNTIASSEVREKLEHIDAKLSKKDVKELSDYFKEDSQVEEPVSAQDGVGEGAIPPGKSKRWLAIALVMLVIGLGSLYFFRNDADPSVGDMALISRSDSDETNELSDAGPDDTSNGDEGVEALASENNTVSDDSQTQDMNNDSDALVTTPEPELVSDEATADEAVQIEQQANAKEEEFAVTEETPEAETTEAGTSEEQMESPIAEEAAAEEVESAETADTVPDESLAQANSEESAEAEPVVEETIANSDPAVVAEEHVAETVEATTQEEGEVSLAEEEPAPVIESKAERKAFGTEVTSHINWGAHTVVRGDTLWHLSAQHLNSPWKYPKLAEWNNISNPDRIYPGDTIRFQRTPSDDV